VFNSPQPARTIGRVFDTPLRAPARVRVVRRRRPTPCRQSSDPPVGRGAQTGLQAGLKGVPEHGNVPGVRRDSEGAAALPDSQVVNRCEGQSGGAGSGGKPDKAGANFDLR